MDGINGRQTVATETQHSNGFVQQSVLPPRRIVHVGRQEWTGIGMVLLCVDERRLCFLPSVDCFFDLLTAPFGLIGSTPKTLLMLKKILIQQIQYFYSTSILTTKEMM